MQSFEQQGDIKSGAIRSSSRSVGVVASTHFTSGGAEELLSESVNTSDGKTFGTRCCRVGSCIFYHRAGKDFFDIAVVIATLDGRNVQ